MTSFWAGMIFVFIAYIILDGMAHRKPRFLDSALLLFIFSSYVIEFRDFNDSYEAMGGVPSIIGIFIFLIISPVLSISRVGEILIEIIGARFGL